MVDFPYDIWLHIASFLPRDQLWYLRFLNQSLHEIAMDNRYRNVMVSLDASSDSKQYRRDFLRFGDKDIAKRVRVIAYFSHAMTDFPESGTSKSTKKLLQAPGIKERFQHYLKGDKTFVVDTIAGFTHVQCMSVQFTHLREKLYRASIPLLHANMHSSSKFLQSLTFLFPFENATDIIPPSLFLPQLASFSMTLFGLEETKDWEIDGLFAIVAATTIVPFINRHRLTLTSLDLRLHEMRPSWSLIAPEIPTNFNLTPLFQGLEHITHLRSASFSISRSTKPDSVARFLNTHSETLQKITIRMTDPTLQTTDGVFDQVKLPFSNLETFSIEYTGQQRVAQDLGSTANLVIQSSLSLTSLKIFKKPLSRDGVFVLLKPPGRTVPSYAKLRYMSMSLQSLTPELINLFASCLPDLQELDLSILKFRRRHTSPESMNEEYEFCLEMGRQNYHYWKLKHFVLLLDKYKVKYGPQKSYGSVAIAGALPCLETFNGLSRAQYILEARSLIAVLPKAQQSALFPWD